MAAEFDFDELDKAVNSLMKDVDPAPTGSEPTAPVVPVVQTPPVVSEQPATTPIVTSPQPAPTPSTTPAAVVKPSGGRFMDVVHPSSDMRTTSAPVVSREGTSLAPVSVTPPVEPAASVEPIATPTQEMAAPASPITSPFLPDAQVEKRPLGGAPEAPSLDAAIAAELSGTNAPEPGEVTELPVEEPTNTTTREPSPPTIEESAPPVSDENPAPASAETVGLPEELNNTLVAIESGEAKPSDDMTSETPAEVDMNESSPSPASALLSQSSIPQQYKEETSSTAEVHAPIYDDQTSAQTLAHPPKKNNLRVLLLAGVIVLIGVAGAIGLYFLQFNR